jgi:cytochrome P450 monooxygenase
MTTRLAGWAERSPLTVLRETRRITFEVILRIIGVEISDLDTWEAQYGDFVYSIFPFIPRWLPGSPTVKADRARVWLDAHIRELTRAARAREDDGTFLSALAHGTDEDGRGVDEAALVDNVRLLILGGHETTSTALAWMTFVLARRPDLWTTLCEEASRAETLPLGPQEVRAYPFAEALFRETVRFYPSASFISRTLTEPLTIAGRHVAAGTIVAVGLAALHRDPALYPDPDRFDPTRWLGRREPPSPLETAPFGGGIHFCLGYHLAWMEGVQFALALARRASARGLRPRLVDDPRHYFLPLGHPTRGARAELS